jgi:hypothetical protein
MNEKMNTHKIKPTTNADTHIAVMSLRFSISQGVMSEVYYFLES